MSNINTIAAFFLPKRKFRRAWFPARASLTTGCHRIGCGHLSQILSCVIIAVMPENVHDIRHDVKWQPRRSLVNSRNRYEILGELKVRWRA